jgi:hypothetical protein
MHSSTTLYFRQQISTTYISSSPRCMYVVVYLFLLFISETTHAQKTRITVYGSQVRDVGVQYELPTGRINQKLGNQTYQAGGGLEWLIKKEVRVELLYLHQGRYSTPPALSGSLSSVKSLNYILAGAGDHFINRNGKLNGFAGIMVGASVQSSAANENERLVNRTGAAFGARIAGNYWLSSTIGLKLETMLLYTSNTSYSSAFAGNADPHTATSIYQVTIGAGLMFNL